MTGREPSPGIHSKNSSNKHIVFWRAGKSFSQSFLLTTGVIFALAVSLWTEDAALRQRAEALWAKAEDVSKIDDKKMAPYHEEGTFTLYHVHAGELQGTYRKEFADVDNWLEEIRLGPYQKFSIHKGDKLYKFENAEFTPRGVQQLTNALPPHKVEADKNESVRKIRSRKLNGVAAVCVEAQIPFPFEAAKHETCMSEADATLLSELKWDQTMTYSSYQPFEGKLPPTRFEVRLGKTKTLDGELRYRERPDLTAASIEVPTGARLEPQCKDKVPVKAEYKPDPEMPAGHHVPGVNVTVALEARIGADGLLKNTMVSQTGGKDFDKAALDAVRMWHFKPSLCDGVPVEMNISIETNFRSSQ